MQLTHVGSGKLYTVMDPLIRVLQIIARIGGTCMLQIQDKHWVGLTQMASSRWLHIQTQLIQHY